MTRMNSMGDPRSALPAQNRLLTAATLLIRSDPLHERRHSANTSRLQADLPGPAVPANIFVRKVGIQFHLRCVLHA